MREYTSFIAPQIQEYILYRMASDRFCKSNEYQLSAFDKYCRTHYPDAAALTQEMADNWCRKRETESNNACRGRISTIRGFINYLRKRGIIEIIEPVMPRENRRSSIPHAFAKTELDNFFRACDEIPCTPKLLEQLRKVTVPVFFRLLYSSGIRAIEARMLKTENVDLRAGILNIKFSKGASEHYVVLHDSMLELMNKYNETITKYFPGRTYFFTNSANSFLKNGWVSSNFRLMWDKYNSKYAVTYDFRHNYATVNINSWMGEGFGFHDKMYYLSKSMGHSKLESTKYYYSLVPNFADILAAHSNSDTVIPEVTR
jgi:integrase